MPSRAPALERGLQVLELLQEGGWHSLEELATRLGFPKSSLMRLLETLLERDYLERCPESKRYRCRVAIYRISQRHNEVRHVIQHALDALCVTLGFTTEWHVAKELHLELMQRAEAAEASVRIRAQVGFRRYWWQEQDALALVSQVACGLKPNREQRATLWEYRQGEAKRLSKACHEKRKAVIDARLLAYDSEYNSNGIRRLVKGVRDKDGSLLGLLAVPIHFYPKADAALAEQLSQLECCGAQLEEQLKPI